MKLRTLVIAAAFSSGLAATHLATAQTSSPEPRPAGPPNAGDVRSLPDAKPGTSVGPTTTPPSSTTDREMNEQRSKRNAAGDPAAGDTRATPGGDRISQGEKDRRTGRAKEETDATGARTRAPADVGTQEKRKDGPDAGVPTNPTRN